MNTKKLVTISLLMGIGAVLHMIIPGVVFGVKPDMMLLMLFLAIILFPEKQNVLLVALIAGFISALTTSFPGGFLPNIIDKFVTAFAFYGLLLVVKKISGSIVTIGVLTVIGTIISGTVFLTSAYYLVGLPKAFLLLFAGSVLPAILLNTVAIVIIYPIVSKLVQKTSIPASI